jgi:hypothetical protein
MYIYYITGAGNSISSQLGSSCQGNRNSTEKAGGTARPSMPCHYHSSPARRAAVLGQPSSLLPHWPKLRLLELMSPSPCSSILLYLSLYKLFRINWWIRSSRLMQRLTVNAKFATDLGSIPASSDMVEFEGRQMLIKVLYKKRKFHSCSIINNLSPVATVINLSHYWRQQKSNTLINREYINIENLASIVPLFNASLKTTFSSISFRFLSVTGSKVHFFSSLKL